MEPLYGAEKFSTPVKNTRSIESFAARLIVLDYDSPTAQHTGKIRTELAKSGQLIGPYDQMIAA
jgi:tRNA(fMet)-specific endonuclease VapC